VAPDTETDSARAHAVVILQITLDAFISEMLSLEPGRICMISSYSQTARLRSMLVLDAEAGR
jgi:hypothetical protein